MTPETRRAVAEDALRTVLRDFDARVPETGPHPQHEWVVPLPPPYGPRRRLVLSVDEREDASDSCRILASGAGYDQRQFSGTRAEVREKLGTPEGVARIEAYLQRGLEAMDEEVEARQPFDLPLVAIHRSGALFAILDHRDVYLEQWGPGKLHCARWRLLLRSGESWRDGGAVNSLAESERLFLHDGVLKTLAAFDGLSVEEFSFRLWKGPLPESGERVSETEADRSDSAVARLRRICHAVIEGTPNQEEHAVRVVKEIAGRTRPQEEPEPHDPALSPGPLTRVLRGLGSLFRRS